MKKVILLLVMVVLIGLYGCKLNTQDKNYQNVYINIDINPSIEIITDEEGMVSAVNALNEDAEMLLLDTNFVGLSVNGTVNKLLESALELGYFEEDLHNAILITVGADTEIEEEIVEEEIVSEVEKFISNKKMKLEVLKKSFEATDKLRAEAETLGVTVGKLKLAKYASEFSSIPLEEAVKLSVRELNEIVKESRQEVKAFYKTELKEEYFAIKDELRVKYNQRVTALIYEKLENLSLEELATLFAIKDSQQLKSLYKAYLDEVTVLLENGIQEEPTDDEDLQKTKQELEQNLKDIIEEFKDIRGKDKRLIANELKEIRKNLQEIENKVHQKIRQNAHAKFELFFAFKDIRRKYVREFAKLDVDLEEFENYYINTLQEDINQIVTELRNELQIVIDDFTEQGQMVRDFLEDQKNVIKSIRE